MLGHNVQNYTSYEATHLKTSHRTDSISLWNYTIKHILMSMTGVHKVQFNLWDCESAKVIHYQHLVAS